MSSPAPKSLALAAGPHGRGRTEHDREEAAASGGALATDGPGLVETSWTPHDPQARVLACEEGIVAAIGGFGSGKSEASALLLLQWALRHPRRADGTPTQWFVVGPEFTQIRREQFKKILNHAKRLSLAYGSIVRRVVYGMDPRIVLRDGQVLIGRSGDQYERMEGPEVDGAWIDECQRQPEKAFSIAVARHRSATAIRVVLSASPEDSPAWIWRFTSGDDKAYNAVREEIECRIERWNSAANKSNSGKVLKGVSAMLEATSPGLAAQKMGGRFPGTREAPSLSPLQFARGFVGRLELSLEEARPAVLGLDVGETKDFCWITILSSRGVLLAQKRFNSGDPGYSLKGYSLQVEEEVRAWAVRWGVRLVVVDGSFRGKPIAEHVEGPLKGRAVVEIVQTGAGRCKPELIEAVDAALGHGDVRVPSSWKAPGGEWVDVAEVDRLRKEWEDLAVKELSKGRRDFDHVDGGHDDGVVSLALAWRGLSKGAPEPDDVDPHEWGVADVGGYRFR